MDLLTNAVESIQVGVEDWQAGSRPRLLSAVRNIHAGILLMYKESLVRLSPPGSDEILIKAKTKPVKEPGADVRFVGVGKKTVDTQQIRERFESLGIITDWEQFKKIADVRNDIEHYYTDVTRDSIRGVIAAAFLIIRSFCVDELDEEPRELLGRPTWEAMLTAAEVYSAERAECDAALSAIEWNSSVLEQSVSELRCTACGSDLLRAEGHEAFDAVLRCRSCGATYDSDVFVPEALSSQFDWDMYVAMKEGSDPPLAECPNCFNETYVLEEGRCALCGTEVEHECARCGTEIPASELGSSPLCGYCEHVMSKDD